MGGVFARRARIVALDAQGTAEDDRVLTKAILERIRSGQKPFALVCIYDQGLLFYFPCLHLQWIEEGSLELLDPLRRESARAHSKKAHALPVSPDLIQQFIQIHRKLYLIVAWLGKPHLTIAHRSILKANLHCQGPCPEPLAAQAASHLPQQRDKGTMDISPPNQKIRERGFMGDGFHRATKRYLRVILGCSTLAHHLCPLAEDLLEHQFRRSGKFSQCPDPVRGELFFGSSTHPAQRPNGQGR